MNRTTFLPEYVFYLISVSALFILVLYRAFTLDITFDEVYTIDLAQQSIRDIFFHPRNFQSANNHILNSILIKPFLFLFGKKIIAIRLPNVIASFFFFIGNMKLSKSLCSDAIGRVSAFFILSLQLYLLDFFSLSRGYGLALMFEVWSLYYIFQFLAKNKQRDNVLSFLFAAFAVLSNFTWINFYLPLWCALNIMILLQGANLRHWLKSNIGPAMIAIVLFLLCFIPISYLKEADEFRWGAPDWLTSMRTLAGNMIYSNHPGGIRLMEFLLAVFFISGILVSIIYFIRKKRMKEISFFNKLTVGIVTILIFIITFSFAQHFFLHTMFMDGRKATMYTTLILCLVIVVSRPLHKAFILPLTAILISISLFYQIQLKCVREWYLDSHLSEALSIMKKELEPAPTITCSWELQTPLQFYNRYVEDETLGLHKVEKKGDDFGDRFWFITNNDIDKLPSGFQLIQSYDNQTFLYTRP